MGRQPDAHELDLLAAAACRHLQDREHMRRWPAATASGSSTVN
jgi:hypothetical protein